MTLVLLSVVVNVAAGTITLFSWFKLFEIVCLAGLIAGRDLLLTSLIAIITSLITSISSSWEGQLLGLLTISNENFFIFYNLTDLRIFSLHALICVVLN